MREELTFYSLLALEPIVDYHHRFGSAFRVHSPTRERKATKIGNPLIKSSTCGLPMRHSGVDGDR